MNALHVEKRTTAPRGEREEISIKALLHWAFATECAHLEFGGAVEQVGWLPPSYGNAFIMHQRGLLGCKVDGGGRSDPHPDADLVAAAVAALPDCLGGARMAIDIAEHARARSSPSGGTHLRTKIEPAEWKMNRHGMRGAAEQIDTVSDVRRGQRVVVPVMIVPIVILNPPEVIEQHREVYLRWRRALAALRDTFKTNNNLTSWAVSDALPTAAPWA